MSSSLAIVSHAALTRDLERLRRRREKLAGEQQEAASRLAGVARRAIDEGMAVTEVARLAGVSRTAVYDLLRRE